MSSSSSPLPFDVQRSVLSVQPSRRDFLRRAGTGAFLASLAPLAFAQSAPPAAMAKYRVSNDTATDLIWMSATRLAQLIREKKVSSTEVVKAYIARIEKVNLKLNAVVQVCFERALAEAAAADQALAAGRLSGPLHGVPMTIKDSIDTAEVISTGGTIGRAAYIPPADATIVARLRAAGAILLGKTNTPEWTLGGGGIPGVSTTANIIYGLSRNPYDLTRSTAGSSGGAGAIVAAGGAPFDIGSDWGGSIRGPSHNNGIAGIKPTFGRVPRTGHIVDFGGIHDTWQQLGPMARRVEDLWTIMPIIAGPDYKDAAIAPMPWADPASVDVKKLRVAFYADTPPGSRTPVTPETIEAVKRSARFLEELGCSVKEDCPKGILAELGEVRSKLSRESVHGMKRLADKWGSKAVSPTITARYESEGVSTEELTALFEKQDETRSKMLQWVKNYDVVLTPVSPTPAQPFNAGASETGGRRGGGGASFNGVHNTTGWPSTVVRAGTSPEGLPIGVQAIAQPWRDDVSLAVAAYLESKTGGWVKPPV